MSATTLTPVASPPPRSSSAPSWGSVHLDAARGVAALLVFLNHTRALYFAPVLAATAPTQTARVAQNANATIPVRGGQLKLASEAVIIFFVLSGYLVGGSVLRSVRSNRWSWTGYLERRLTRLYVVLIPAIFLGWLLDHLGLRIFGIHSIYGAPAGLDLVPTAHLAARLSPLVVLGNLLFLQGIHSEVMGSNVALWSLSYEFWYYIAFPLFVLSFHCGSRYWFRALCLVLACGVLWFTGSAVAILFPIWFMGAAINLLPRSLRSETAKWLSMAGVILLVGGMLAVRILPVATLPAEYILAILCSLVFYLLIQQTEPATDGVYRKTSKFFSDTSFSLYLYHLPLAVFLCALLNSPWHSWSKTPLHFTIWLFTDLAILAIVTELWKRVEANTETIRVRLFGA